MKRREFIRMGGDRCQTTLKSEKRKNHCSPWDQLWGSFPGLLREASNFLQWSTGNHPTGEPNCASRSVLKSATSPSLQSLQTQAREWPLKALLILYLDIPLPLKGTRGGLELYCRAFWSFPSLLLSHSLGVFDGSIQGAEEGSTFLHHTVEVHLMEKVTLGITEILGAKPAQNRQADISGKVSGEKWSWNRHFFSLFFNSVSIPTHNSHSREPRARIQLPPALDRRVSHRWERWSITYAAITAWTAEILHSTIPDVQNNNPAMQTAEQNTTLSKICLVSSWSKWPRG